MSVLIYRAASVVAFSLTALPVLAQENAPSLTVYNQGFAVVRESLRLDLKKGANEVRFDRATAHVEPDSVVLRDPTGKRTLRLFEQNYEGDPLSQEALLVRYEGKTIDFLVQQGEKQEIVRGKIVRAPYVIHQRAMQRYGQQYAYGQMAYGGGFGGGGSVPIVEVDGKMRFGLPGTPLFPSLGDDALLRPTLSWTLETETPGPLNAELSYITGGMSWEADYNMVSGEKENLLDVVGLMTIDNQSGASFVNARLQLMAGDVNKVQPQFYGGGFGGGAAFGMRDANQQPVAEKSFDEYHLYTLNRPTTLKDHETKQVEFVKASRVPSERIYVYDGFDPAPYRNYNFDTIGSDRNYGTQSNKKIWVMREFKNNKENNLGLPLPKGRVRFYRKDDATGALQFVGENTIDHTPKDETVRVYTGDAFDLVGERRQTDYKVDGSSWVDESFEITLRNHKSEPVTVRVVEHLYRWSNWELTQKSQEYTKKDSRTIEFAVPLAPNEEKKVTYTVHYTWTVK